MAKEQAYYSHGHHSSVVNSHALRTIHDSAAFLIPHIKPTHRILDIGCGPGSITVGFGPLVPQGSVIGVDSSESVLEQARTLTAQKGVENVSFATDDANALSYSDGTFDVVYCHQVLQHVKDPVGILREMRRVSKAGGIVAARDADYSSFAWFPAHSALDKWRDVYFVQARANGGEPNAGRMLHVWGRLAGFEAERMQSSVTSWCYTGDRASRWGQTWADRTTHSRFAEIAKSKGAGGEEEIQAIADGWRDWSRQEDLWFSIPSGELLYQVPS